MKFFDLTVPLSTDIPVYPGNPRFELSPVTRIAGGDPANVSRLGLGTHTGTHVDAPRHFIEGAASAERLPLELLIGRTRVLEVQQRRAIGADHLDGLDVTTDIRLLIKTGNSALWKRKEFVTDYAFLTADAARHLVDAGVKVVGIDYLSLEEFEKPGAPAHHVLLSNGVVIIEGLNLSEVEPGVYEMMCLPLPVVGGDGAPARVVLRHPASS